MLNCWILLQHVFSIFNPEGSQIFADTQLSRCPSPVDTLIAECLADGPLRSIWIYLVRYIVVRDSMALM
jgi:hypothetical protein